MFSSVKIMFFYVNKKKNLRKVSWQKTTLKSPRKKKFNLSSQMEKKNKKKL